jgi:hypothetical protein
MRQTAPRKGALPWPLRTAETCWIAETPASPTSRRPSVQVRGLWECCRQQGTMPSPCQPEKEGPAPTSPPALLRHAGPLQIRWLRQTSCGRRLLRRPRRPVLWRPSIGPALQAKVGCDFPGSLERFEEVHHKNGESAAIIGQRTSNCGPAACSRPGAASAT